MRFTASGAKNRLGTRCAQARRKPFRVKEAGELDPVILSAGQDQLPKAGQDQVSRVALHAGRRWKPIAATGSPFNTPTSEPMAFPVPIGPLVNEPWRNMTPSPSRVAAHPSAFLGSGRDPERPARCLAHAIDHACGRTGHCAGKVPAAMCPVSALKGVRLPALATRAAPLPATLLRHPVGNVADHASALSAASGAVLPGIGCRPAIR